MLSRSYSTLISPLYPSLYHRVREDPHAEIVIHVDQYIKIRYCSLSIIFKAERVFVKKNTPAFLKAPDLSLMMNLLH